MFSYLIPFTPQMSSLIQSSNLKMIHIIMTAPIAPITAKSLLLHSYCYCVDFAPKLYTKRAI